MTRFKIILILALFISLFRGCILEDRYFDGRLSISYDPAYPYTNTLDFDFKPYTDTLLRIVDKYGNAETKPKTKYAGYTIVGPHIIDYKHINNRIFLTRIGEKNVFSKEELDSNICSHYDLEIKDYTTRMQNLLDRKELYKYYYYDNDSLALFGPYNKAEISKIAKSYGFSYPD